MIKYVDGELTFKCDTCGAVLAEGNATVKDFVEYQDGKIFCDTGIKGCDTGSRDVGQKRYKR